MKWLGPIHQAHSNSLLLGLRFIECSHPFIRRRHYSNTQSSIPRANADETTANIPVGLSGSIELKTRHPPRPSHDSRVVIYLSRGHFEHQLLTLLGLQSPATQLDPLHVLSLGANATVVSIGYRLDQRELYPRPVHDVLTGFDWVLKHLVQDQGSSSGSRKSPKIGVCGELIGGGLATMLALTECHANKPGISAAAIGDPVVDWPSLLLKSDLEGNEVAKGKSEKLRVLQRALSPNLEQSFDPFVSPLLFMRTPSYEIGPDRRTSPSVDDRGHDSDTSPTITPKRRSHRKYPPLGSGLRLPWTRIEAIKASGLEAQSLELAELMRRSVDMWEEKPLGSESQKFGEARVRVEERQALWGERDLFEVGRWFAEVL